MVSSGHLVHPLPEHLGEGAGGGAVPPLWGRAPVRRHTRRRKPGAFRHLLPGIR